MSMLCLLSVLAENVKMFLSVAFCPLQYLQKLPWESMSFLKSLSLSRMPSLHSLIGLCIQKEVRLSIHHR